MTLIFPRTQQMRSLKFIRNHWQDIVSFSEFNSNQLPLLRTLKIIYPTILNSHSQPNVVTSPSLPIFRGSTDLEQFVFHSPRLSHLSHFIFLKLTTFKLVSHPGDEHSASYLLEFLKASPMLQTVKVNISATVTLSSLPPEMVVVLPNVKTFSLLVANGPMTHIYDIAAHISRPCTRHTSLTSEVEDTRMSVTLKIFPTLASQNTIVHQHTGSPVKEVTLEIQAPKFDDIKSFLTFWFFNATVVKFGFNINETGVDRDELIMTCAKMGWEIFSQALMTIQDHP